VAQATPFYGNDQNMNRALIHRRAQRLLPAGIQTCGLLNFGVAPGQVERVLLGSAFRCDAQGVVVLRLAAATALAIQRQGLAFFEQSSIARAALPQRLPTHYGQWWPVLLDEAGLAAGAGGAADALAAGGHALTAQRAGYFAVAQDQRGWLTVLPVERLVIYGWWN
jgi:hypothetical protein